MYQSRLPLLLRSRAAAFSLGLRAAMIFVLMVPTGSRSQVVWPALYYRSWHVARVKHPVLQHPQQATLSSYIEVFKCKQDLI
jgi:hypothetical protein